MSQREDGRGEVTVTVIIQDWERPILPTEFVRVGYDFETPEEATVYREELLHFLKQLPQPGDVVRPFPRREASPDDLETVLEHVTEERLPEDLVEQQPLDETGSEQLDVPEFLRRG